MNAGLAAQHLTGVGLVSAMHQGSLSGAAVRSEIHHDPFNWLHTERIVLDGNWRCVQLRSSELSFVPGDFQLATYVADIQTAGYTIRCNADSRGSNRER